MASRGWSSESLVWLTRNAGWLAALLACALGLLWIYDLETAPALFLVLVLAWAAVLGWMLWRLRGTSPPVAAVLIVAGLLRVLLLPLPPAVSDDVYRYVWDGRIVRAGFNPYALTPDAPALVPLRDELWAEVAHRDVETIYPPLALSLFAFASAFGAPLLVLKAILAIVDLGCCWLLLRYAAGRGAPTVRVLAYAFHPLVVFETAGMGHVDALGLPFLVLAAMVLSASMRREGSGTGEDRLPVRAALRVAGLLAMGVLAKLVPLLLVPAFARQSRRAAMVVVVVVGLTLGAFSPFLGELGGLPPGLVAYGVSWEFNGPVFEPLWRALDVVGAASGARWLLDRAPRWGDGELLAGVYAYLYPQLLAKILTGFALGAVLVWSTRSRDPAVAALRVFGGWTLLSATVYPWYLMWLLPWAVLLARGPWLLLSATVLFAYLPSLYGVALWPWAYLLVWAPPLAAFLWRRRSGTG